jgi:glycosyltransferase involved in cell wall biosynthesis
MRICVVYDCLYPHTVGGAERWYRALAERLRDAGHDVTYLTLRQWPRGTDPGVAGVEVVSVGPRLALYTEGRRRILPPLVFGAGVFLHLVRRGRRYDVVHTASFPYFSLLAASALRRFLRVRLFVDWLEVWTRQYWRDYLGSIGGAIGWRIQRLCVRTRHRAFCLSRLHAERLREEGFRGEIVLLRGLYAGTTAQPAPRPPERLVVFAGRHIPEKRVTAIPGAVAEARHALPELRAEIYGDGPERPELLRRISELGLEHVVKAPGIVASDRVAEALAVALCLLLPSQREGYGLVVVEAGAAGTPALVVAGPDNAAAELIEDGVNGLVVASAEPRVMAEGIVRIDEAGEMLRTSTARWFARNQRALSIDSSLEAVLAAYAEDSDE